METSNRQIINTNYRYIRYCARDPLRELEPWARATEEELGWFQKVGLKLSGKGEELQTRPAPAREHRRSTTLQLNYIMV